MRDNRKKQRLWVSASDVGRAAYCPHSLELEKNGVKPSEFAVKARKKGEAGHETLNRRAADNRCYIASHLYGMNDTRTETLRKFRDNHLLNHLAGNICISIYYLLSPMLVIGARRSSLLDCLLRYITDNILRIIERPKSDD